MIDEDDHVLSWKLVYKSKYLMTLLNMTITGLLCLLSCQCRVPQKSLDNIVSVLIDDGGGRAEPGVAFSSTGPRGLFDDIA